MSRAVVVFAVLCVTAGCGRFGVDLLPSRESSDAPDRSLEVDSGTDAGTDAGSHAPVDASADGMVDSPVDGGLDSAVESACATPCANDHGSADCSTGKCQVSCAIGYSDCDGDPGNGCETASSSDSLSCGGCGIACTTAYGTTQCTDGFCMPSCVPGKSGDCDSVAANGCETDLTTDRQACGSCGTTCSNAHGSTSCIAGVCTPVCAADYADCDGNPVNGCEAQIATDPSNCGGCGMKCDTSFQVCANKQCQASMCPQGLANCDANQADCETNVANTVSDCGFCDNACTAANGTPRCSSGSCAIASCDAGYADCDGNAANGCEVLLATSVANCGSCTTACTNTHGSTSCSSGGCAPVCSTGWGSCDGNARNGCETPLDTLTNCGSCGHACPNAMAGATAVCNAGICGYTCNTLSGVYGLRIDATTSWPAQQYVQSGSGPIQFWMRLTLTQSGTTLSGSAALCDQSTPEFRNSVTSDRYLVDYPSALFTPGAPAAAFSATLASLSPGASLSSARSAHLLGLSMADPLNGAWPSLSGVLSSQVDHDADGEVGITVVFVDDSTYNHAQTAGTLFAARASNAYGAQRLRFSLAGALSGCTGASGAATVQSFDTETIGCRLESGSDCSSSQYTHLHDNAVVHTVSKASYVLTRLGASGSSFTCAQVRSAL